jgi:hypothetical protein
MLDNGAAITLAGNALASGIKSLKTAAGGNTVDVTKFFGQLSVTGGYDPDLVQTSFAALSGLNFNGGFGDDTLQLLYTDSRAIVSLQGSFDALDLDAGNNFVALGDDAGLSAIYGGDGFDTIDMRNNNTGINFVMRSAALGSNTEAASLAGGKGDDTITLADAPTGEFFDSRFSLLGAAQLTMYDGRIENFLTHIDGGNKYNLGVQAEACGINRVFFSVGDTLDASNFKQTGDFTDIRALDFVYKLDSELNSSTIIGTNLDDTLTLRNETGGRVTGIDQAVADTVFQRLSSIEVFVFENSTEVDGSPNDLSIILGINAENLGINKVIGGAGDDTMDASAYTTNGIDMTGGYGNDVLTGGGGGDTLTGTTSTALGANEIDTLMGGSGNDFFVLGDATNAYYNTGARASDYALITDFTAGDKIQLKDLSALYATVAPAPTNQYGYLIDGTDIHGVGALGVGVNSYLYADTDKSGTITTGDNLIAAINSTGGALTAVNATNFTIV